MNRFLFVAALVACAIPSARVRADFVDELPLLPFTPAPLPSATVGASGGKRLPSAKVTAPPGKQGAAQGNTGAAPSNSTPASAKSGGLFGSDAASHNSNAPISTQGDTLEGSLNTGKMVLTGNVVIQQDDTTMKSDVAEVYSKPGTTTPERAVAKGRVSILKRVNPRVPELRAVADEIEYFVNERRVILKGKPKIWRGKELVQGEVIEMALDSGDIRIRSARSILDPAIQGDLKGGGKKRGAK